MKHWILCVVIGISAISSADAQVKDCFPKKDEMRLVYDEANMLQAAEETALNEKLVAFARETSNQIVVVITSELCGYAPAVYGTEIIEVWGIGQAKEDNGVALIIKPKTPQERGEYFIAIGRGLEHVIPDASAHVIGENELIPSLKQGNYYAAVDSTTNVLMELARGEYNIQDYTNTHQPQAKKPAGWGPFFFIIMILFLFFGLKALQVRRYARRNNLTWLAAWMLLNATERQHRGYFDDFRGGHGGFGGWGGGGGGGGFGGFGGGSSGGGGAGGSW
jgi:uncharacterized protein